MDNVLKDKNKNLRCLQWVVHIPSRADSTILSETFLVQNRICYLKLRRENYNGCYPYLCFECNGDRQPQIGGMLHVVSNSKTLAQLGISIVNLNQRIWHSSVEITGTLIFELILHGDCSNDDKSVQTPSHIDNCFLLDGISQDFSKMLNESPSHDLEFICGDQNIKAHKSVLSCRSDVFASMLKCGMVEGKTGRVHIQDMDATLFRQFLKCLYTGVLPTLTVDTALQFYEAGDKYNISSLRKQCADFLSDNLLPENACDILILADQHNDPDFKKNVIDFMVKKQMPYTGKKWISFCTENPILANEVLNLFCQQLRPK